jgi:3-hydroxybutyryl-CoA dehydrogenase
MKRAEINTLAVIGAGTMGRGIAYASCLAGYQTKLYDISEEILKQAGHDITTSFQKATAKGTVTHEVAATALSRLQTTTVFENAVNFADFVIEAVPEKAGMKIEVFAKLELHTPKHAVLATNTSSLSVTEIAGATQRPRQVLGMHFFNPVPLMKLIEIIRGLETDDATVEITQKVALAMHKEPVVINESPGFITTRINAMIGNEAFYMLQEGVASAEEIDKALKLGLNHPMGPFELVDLVGLDTRLNILNFLHQALGEKFRPCPLLVKYVKAGRLGRKVGRGVYEYPKKN